MAEGAAVNLYGDWLAVSLGWWTGISTRTRTRVVLGYMKSIVMYIHNFAAKKKWQCMVLCIHSIGTRARSKGNK